MDVWLFGNPDLPEDSLPLRLLPKLRASFPQHTFVVRDPLDEWQFPEKLYIIDTVKGIEHVAAFTSLDEFAQAPSVTLHDFDALSELRLRQKLQPLPPLVIFGVPPTLSEKQTLTELTKLLNQHIQ